MKRAHAPYRHRVQAATARRAPWVRLVEGARAMALRVTAPADWPAPHPGLDGFEELRHVRAACKAADFPIEGESTGLMAEAFLKALDAFAGRSVPAERRLACVDAVLALGTFVMDRLDEQRQAEADQSWQRRAMGVD